MTNLIKRTELNYLNDWLAQKSRKPLVIRGARQVGKSTLVRQFAEQPGLRFNADLPSILHDTTTLTDGTRLTYQLVSLPLYLAGQTQRILNELDK